MIPEDNGPPTPAITGTRQTLPGHAIVGCTAYRKPRPNPRRRPQAGPKMKKTPRRGGSATTESRFQKARQPTGTNHVLLRTRAEMTVTQSCSEDQSRPRGVLYHGPNEPFHPCRRAITLTDAHAAPPSTPGGDA